MRGFTIKTGDSKPIRFKFYHDAAPNTVIAFSKTLPFSQTFFQAKFSGEEIWTSNAPELQIIQENSSVFTETGEIVIGPKTPVRVRTAGCMGIYYGEGKGFDACNIFGKVLDEDLNLLKELGKQIWMTGGMALTFDLLP